MLRRMEEKDISSVYELERQCLSVNCTLEMLRAELHNPLAQYFVLEHKSLIIGYSGMYCVLDETHICDVAVHPLWRNKGFGYQLINNIIDVANNLGCPNITLEVRVSNAHAISLYKKFGFKECGVRKKYYSDGEDALIMWKNPENIK